MKCWFIIDRIFNGFNCGSSSGFGSEKNCDSVDDESFFDFFVVGDLDKNESIKCFVEMSIIQISTFMKCKH